jgi:hypothetical protein
MLRSRVTGPMGTLFSFASVEHMRGNVFDALSRALAIEPLPRRRGLPIAITALAQLFGRNSAAQAPTPLSCNPMAVVDCLNTIVQRTQLEFEDCAAVCQANVDPIRQQGACAHCYGTAISKSATAVRQCHEAACGLDGLCSTVHHSTTISTGYCCPRGCTAVSRDDKVECVPGCHDLVADAMMTCRAPYKLNTEYCECECDFEALKCHSGMAVDPDECRCV